MISEPTFSQASACHLSKPTIFTKAESIAQELNYCVGADLEPVIQGLGGKIHYVSLEEWYNTQDASIRVSGKNNFEIYISNFTGPLRNRFSLAHELGHYFLHSVKGEKKIVAARSGSNLCEWEANWFAAAFLMPEKEFKRVVEKFSHHNMDYVAAHFLVSRKAADVRYNSIFTS
ncbi:PF06114 domain protein [Leptospira noguchii str. 2006001870]|uniref:ImmA/IrrE family metallo-endopeptidase n=1 Tax=Leptospira noguchii TaxID=28182 RepID=UPI0002488DD3|nr:ImmA/IrrE family metallo-endopeptidase [Leptospira noguchii]EKR71931.1 PF06114 domain protein [Leptospira noguchii str. 2006001870]